MLSELGFSARVSFFNNFWRFVRATVVDFWTRVHALFSRNILIANILSLNLKSESRGARINLAVSLSRRMSTLTPCALHLKII